MVKFFCDICDREVPTEYHLRNIRFFTDEGVSEHSYHACEACINNILKCINKLKEESKNGTT